MSTPVKLIYYSAQTRAGEPFLGRVPKLSINFEQNLTHPHDNSEQQYKVLNLPYLLTPWSRVLLEKLTGSQLVKKFPAFYGTRRFNAAFTSARQLPLS